MNGTAVMQSERVPIVGAAADGYSVVRFVMGIEAWHSDIGRYWPIINLQTKRYV